MELFNLKNTTRPKKRRKLLGRGVGSGLGKTAGRGQKGAGARSGYKRRAFYEGGQMRLHMKMPQRGFSRARFQKKLETINLFQIEQSFQDGETVNLDTLRKAGLITGHVWGVKLLGDGEITKKVTIEVNAMSSSAKSKLHTAGLSYTLK